MVRRDGLRGELTGWRRDVRYAERASDSPHGASSRVLSRHDGGSRGSCRGLSVVAGAGAERARRPTDRQQRSRAPNHGGSARALGPGEPPHARDAEKGRNEEVQSQPQDVVRGIDPQRLLEYAKARVAGDVQREDPRRTNPSPSTKDDQGGRQCEIEDQLVEKGRMERREVLVAGGPMGRVDPQAPRQRRRGTEQLLVEVVADPPDGLGDEQARRRAVHEGGDVHASPAQTPDPDGRAQGDSAPDAETTPPDGERPPPR